MKIWSHPPGLNRRPADYESAALPTELGWPAIQCNVRCESPPAVPVIVKIKRMPLIKASSVNDLPPGSVTEVQSGDFTYAVCNVDGKVYCLDGTCPHAGGPLGQGNLNGNYLVCPWHGWEYDCRTGLNDSDEDVKVDTYPVQIQNGDILIDVP